jgi:hypothetical protein
MDVRLTVRRRPRTPHSQNLGKEPAEGARAPTGLQGEHAEIRRIRRPLQDRWADVARPPLIN